MGASTFVSASVHVGDGERPRVGWTSRLAHVHIGDASLVIGDPAACLALAGALTDAAEELGYRVTP